MTKYTFTIYYLGGSINKNISNNKITFFHGELRTG